ncbi:MAG: MAPEG family protein [Pseudomonadales bacterium]|nr:MAPEG family protein [Pseudomonadales bacterium]
MQHQKEVQKQIVMGLIVLATIGLLGWFLLPTLEEVHRSIVLAGSLLILAIPLFLSIAILVIGRYSNEHLITGYTSSSDQLAFKKAHLQNTLEQTAVNLLPLLALSIALPAAYLKLCIIQSFAFIVGRLLFFIGYNKDPMARFTGFIVGWYAAAVSFVVASYFVMGKII